jgi:hypothetical protein
MSESINDKAVTVLGAIRDIEALLPSPNDIGEPSGFHDEFDALVNDTHAMLGMLRNRARILKVRLERNSSTIRRG